MEENVMRRVADAIDTIEELKRTKEIAESTYSKAVAYIREYPDMVEANEEAEVVAIKRAEKAKKVMHIVDAIFRNPNDGGNIYNRLVNII